MANSLTGILLFDQVFLLYPAIQAFSPGYVHAMQQTVSDIATIENRIGLFFFRGGSICRYLQPAGGVFYPNGYNRNKFTALQKNHLTVRIILIIYSITRYDIQENDIRF